MIGNPYSQHFYNITEMSNVPFWIEGYLATLFLKKNKTLFNMISKLEIMSVLSNLLTENNIALLTMTTSTMQQCLSIIY